MNIAGPMPTRRNFLLSGTFVSAAARLLVVPCGLAAAPAIAADASATAFVTKIYDAYKGKDAKGINYGAEAVIRRYALHKGFMRQSQTGCDSLRTSLFRIEP